MDDLSCSGCRTRAGRIVELEARVLELERFQRETAFLRAEAKTERDLRQLTGDSNAMKEVRQAVQQVARTESTVLILGETGTGKELVARAIHQLSPRRDHLLVKVNCAALAMPIIASELFGHVVCEPWHDCKYTDCVAVCPYDCFCHDDMQLYIDPKECIDCEACVPECPVDAIFHDTAVPVPWAHFIQLNAERSAALMKGAGHITEKIDPKIGPGCRACRP